MIYSLITWVSLCDSGLAPCEACGFDHSTKWKNVCWQNNLWLQQDWKNTRELAVVVFIPGSDCIFKISWRINGIKYLSGDDGPPPEVLGLRPCDDTVCCLQHSFKTIWYVVLFLHRCYRFACIWEKTSPRSHSSAYEKLYFGTQYKKTLQQRWEQSCLTGCRLNNDTD